jgi:hypothetical protein
LITIGRVIVMSIEQLKELEDLREEKSKLTKERTKLLSEKMEPQITELQAAAKETFMEYMESNGFEVRQNEHAALAKYKGFSVAINLSDEGITVTIGPDDHKVEFVKVQGEVRMAGGYVENNKDPKQGMIYKFMNEIAQLKADIANVERVKMGYKIEGEKTSTTNFQQVLEQLFK